MVQFSGSITLSPRNRSRVFTTNEPFALRGNPAYVEVLFYDDYLTTKHYLNSRTNDYAYSHIKSVEYLYTRVLGRRLIFKCTGTKNKLMEFMIYNPDDELIEFISVHINTYKNRVT